MPIPWIDWVGEVLFGPACGAAVRLVLLLLWQLSYSLLPQQCFKERVLSFDVQ